MRLKDKVALVTGGASGFGAEIVRSFAQEGAKVVILDLNGEGAAKVAKDAGASVLAIPGDVTKRVDVDKAIGKTTDSFGRLDVVVNNAGWTHRNKSLLEVTEEEFDRVYAINVKSIFHMTKAVVPVMSRQGGGNIINIGSNAVVLPLPILNLLKRSQIS